MLPKRKRTGPGRPSLYKPEYCEAVEMWGRQGKSRAQLCSLLNISRNTLNDWERQFPEFHESLARAMAHSQHWWEEKAQKSLGKRHFQAQLWRYSMAGRFKEDYAETKSNDANGLDLGALVGAISQGVAAATLQASGPKDDAATAAQDVVPNGVAFAKPSE